MQLSGGIAGTDNEQEVVPTLGLGLGLGLVISHSSGVVEFGVAF